MFKQRCSAHALKNKIKEFFSKLNIYKIMAQRERDREREERGVDRIADERIISKKAESQNCIIIIYLLYEVTLL